MCSLFLRNLWMLVDVMLFKCLNVEVGRMMNIGSILRWLCIYWIVVYVFFMFLLLWIMVELLELDVYYVFRLLLIVWWGMVGMSLLVMFWLIKFLDLIWFCYSFLKCFCVLWCSVLKLMDYGLSFFVKCWVIGKVMVVNVFVVFFVVCL